MSDDKVARELTDDEVRDRFLQHVWALVNYWAGDVGLNVPPDKPVRDRLSGLAFSILAEIDGCGMALPAFVLAPSPHPDDAAYLKERGLCWFPQAGEVEHDIAGGLHEHFHRFDPKRPPPSEVPA